MELQVEYWKIRVNLGRLRGLSVSGLFWGACRA